MNILGKNATSGFANGPSGRLSALPDGTEPDGSMKSVLAGKRTTETDFPETRFRAAPKSRPEGSRFIAAHFVCGSRRTSRPGAYAPLPATAGKRLSLQTFGPLPEALFVGAVEQSSLLPVRSGMGFSQGLRAMGDAAPSRRGERDDRLALQVVAFDERVDDPGREVPPDRIADENRVVVLRVRLSAADGRTGLRIVHFRGAARPLVVPVEVVGRVGPGRDDRVKRASRGFGQPFGGARRRAGRREIGYQDSVVGCFLVHVLSLLCACRGGDPRCRRQRE